MQKSCKDFPRTASNLKKRLQTIPIFSSFQKLTKKISDSSKIRNITVMLLVLQKKRHLQQLGMSPWHQRDILLKSQWNHSELKNYFPDNSDSKNHTFEGIFKFLIFIQWNIWDSNSAPSHLSQCTWPKRFWGKKSQKVKEVSHFSILYTEVIQFSSDRLTRKCSKTFMSKWKKYFID